MKYFFYSILFISSFYAEASLTDSTNGLWGMQIRGDYGFVIAHRPALEPLQEEHVKGFELTLTRPTTGKNYWENIFLYPEYGITIAGFDLGSPSHLGKGFVVYPFIDFPLGKKGFQNLHFRYGMGLGYAQKPFDKETNIKNAAIGSKINGVIHFDLHYEAKLSARSAIEIGTGITHYSNGSFDLPNLGINIATVNLAIHHSFGKNIPKIHGVIPETDKRVQYHVYTGGFFKKIYPPEGKFYFACTISALRFKPITLKSAWGIGADLFYDNSLKPRVESMEGESGSFDNFRPGIYGAYHLSAGKLGMMFNMGFYLYNAWKNDGNVYHRICLRYYFDKIFLCVNLKTHYARADFVEMGIGIRFKKD